MLKDDRRHSIRSKTWFYLIAIVLVSVSLFAIANQTHIRSDWTENKIYTLSDSTKTVLNALDEPLMIRAYLTKDMPQPYGRLQRFMGDILQSYHEAGHGRVGVEVVDPASNPNVQAALKALHVPKVQVQVVEDDHAQVKQGYLAVVLEYLDKKETIAVVQSEEGFEYNLTRKIKKLTGKGRVKIAVANNDGAHTPQDLQQFSAWVQDDYELVPVDLDSKPLADDIQALLVVGMLHAPSKTWREHVQSFYKHGGNLWILAGNARPDLSQGFQVQAADADANDWLKEDFSVAVDTGLVMDKRAQRVLVRNDIFQSKVDYPFVVDALDIDDTHIITRNIDSVSVPFASPLIVVKGKAHVLMRSSPWSAVQQGPPFDVYPLMSIEKRFEGLQLSTQNLAYVFDNTAIPAADTDAQQVGAKKGRLLIIGSPGFLDNEFMGGTGLVMVINTLDWLVHDEALIDLRSRGVAQRPLAALSATGKIFFKAFWMFGLPILVLFFGLWRWISMRKKSA